MASDIQIAGNTTYSEAEHGAGIVGIVAGGHINLVSPATWQDYANGLACLVGLTVTESR